MPKKGIPDRWLEYSNFGKCISGTRFLAFKVPLHERLCSPLPREQHWTPHMALRALQNVGLVIDLTYTTRYYDPQVLKEGKIEYLKIPCQGHGRLPGSKNLDRFFTAVSEYLNDTWRTGQLIAVHCTHGLNRTGYFVCRYMIDQMGFSPSDAITAFNEARGHKMERLEYLDALSRDSSLSRMLTNSLRLDSRNDSVNVNQRGDYESDRNPIHFRQTQNVSSGEPYQDYVSDARPCNFQVRDSGQYKRGGEQSNPYGRSPAPLLFELPTIRFGGNEQTTHLPWEGQDNSGQETSNKTISDGLSPQPQWSTLDLTATGRSQSESFSTGSYDRSFSTRSDFEKYPSHVSSGSVPRTRLPHPESFPMGSYDHSDTTRNGFPRRSSYPPSGDSNVPLYPPSSGPRTGYASDSHTWRAQAPSQSRWRANTTAYRRPYRPFKPSY